MSQTSWQDISLADVKEILTFAPLNLAIGANPVLHYTLPKELVAGEKIKYTLVAGFKTITWTGIIGAMIINPKVLILDEPFNYLDPSSQITVAKLIRQMNEQLGTTVIISSHNLSFVSEISTRILLLEKGRIIKDLNNHDGSATKELEEYFNTAE